MLNMANTSSWICCHDVFNRNDGIQFTSLCLLSQQQWEMWAKRQEERRKVNRSWVLTQTEHVFKLIFVPDGQNGNMSKSETYTDLSAGTRGWNLHWSSSGSKVSLFMILFFSSGGMKFSMIRYLHVCHTQQCKSLSTSYQEKNEVRFRAQVLRKHDINKIVKT